MKVLEENMSNSFKPLCGEALSKCDLKFQKPHTQKKTDKFGYK